MPCYSPLQAWRGRKLVDGKTSIVWRKTEADPALVDSELKLPCGQCIGCRLERSRQWAMRCVHEASLYKDNCFITLTYDGSRLFPSGGLCMRDFQLFMKRLRKQNVGKKIRFFHCGEYGELGGRPHYHACLFNHDFSDKVLWSVRDGVRLYRSVTLENLWSLGFSTVGDVTFQSAAYVARYIMKKVIGDGKDVYVNELTGECRDKEYVTMSRRPGIGRGWYDKFKLDLYPSDFGIINGMKVRPPKFYDHIFDVEFPEEFKKVKARRLTFGRSIAGDNDVYRLAVKEGCKKSRVKQLIRPMEVGI